MTTGIRGAFFDFIDDPWKHVGREQEAARFQADGLLVIEDGRIVDFGNHDEVAPRHRGLEVTHIADRLILPGFIDGHIHFPQTRVVGAFGEQLLSWLQVWVFPEELKYKDRAYAADAAHRFFDNLLAAGTTTCQAFTSSSPVSAECLFDEAERPQHAADRRADRHRPLRAGGLRQHARGILSREQAADRALPPPGPRPLRHHAALRAGLVPELLEACQRLKSEHPDCWVNTHISETRDEVRAVEAEFADCARLSRRLREVRIGRATLLRRPRHLAEGGRVRPLLRSGAAVVFCPCSNLFLGSGLFRIGRATDPRSRVRLAWGSDVGAGNRFSLLGALDEGYKIGMLNNSTATDAADAERNKISPYRGFWSITLGGAEALYLDDWSATSTRARKPISSRSTGRPGRRRSPGASRWSATASRARSSRRPISCSAS